MSNELYHHGIKGQKWGVRRFQNEDGSYTEEGKRRYNIKESSAYVLPKGSTIYRVSTAKKERSMLNPNTYAYTDVDKKVYEGAYSTYLKMRYGGRKVYKKTYVTKKDLVAPSEEKAKQLIENRITTDPVVRSKVAMYGSHMIQTGHPAIQYAFKDGNKKLPSDPKTWNEHHKNVFDKNMSFLAYNVMIENDKRELQNLINDTKKLGYNAIMDYNNKDVYNNSVEPFIAINSKTTIKEIKNEELTKEYISKTMSELEKEIGRRPVI